jgi:hypothetical protein
MFPKYFVENCRIRLFIFWLSQYIPSNFTEIKRSPKDPCLEIHVLQANITFVLIINHKYKLMSYSTRQRPVVCYIGFDQSKLGNDHLESSYFDIVLHFVIEYNKNDRKKLGLSYMYMCSL